MKKGEITKIIERVVRKEVKKQMSEIFIKEEGNSSSLTELVSKSLTEKEFKEPIRKEYKVGKKEEIKYTKDKAINKVLNETRGGLPQGDGTESYPTMGGGIFDSNKVTEVAMQSGEFGNTGEFKRELGAAMTAKAAGVPVEKVPESTMKALTRDYSGLMKAIDKKKTNGV
ncbi:uncharacterized protein METZ01_LOCUS144219 [marine metagenome]|jgi:hypothetical protein|uniref:Uncharacterized protein n=1 Tax=marine metagenome TaxID=408172 RepID=A0A381ZQ28_9ZZZZ|tara:strand:- start:135 stop:644 length:510 start_codon:yes stop_codon:yes gene_type:complete